MYVPTNAGCSPAPDMTIVQIILVDCSIRVYQSRWVGESLTSDHHCVLCSFLLFVKVVITCRTYSDALGLVCILSIVLLVPEHMYCF